MEWNSSISGFLAKGANEGRGAALQRCRQTATHELLMEKNEVVGVSFLLRVAGFSLRWRPEMELRHVRNTRS